MQFHGKDSLTQHISAWYRNWQIDKAGKSELAGCSNGEIDAMAADVGLSSADFRTLAARGAHAADLLPCRLRLFGLNPGQVQTENPVLYRDMERLCSGCESKGRCKRDLNRTFFSWASYCPNEATVSGLISDHDARMNQSRSPVVLRS